MELNIGMCNLHILHCLELEKTEFLPMKVLNDVSVNSDLF